MARRSTLADANELRGWRIWADLAAVLIRRARKLYANDSIGVELYTLHKAGAFFVPRAKSPMDARRAYSATTERTTRVLCDQRVMLDGFYSAKKYPQYLWIKHFLGNRESAVKTKMWRAVATYLLIVIVKRQLHLDSSLYTPLQTLAVNMLKTMSLQQAFAENAQPSNNPIHSNQLNLLGV